MAKVSTRGAQQALKALENLLARIRYVEGVNDFQLLQQDYTISAPGVAYRNIVRQKLEGSDLALRLLDGLGAFPDIVEAMHPALRPFERLFLPRSVAQTACYLARHLAFYLDPKTETPRYGLRTLWHLGDLLQGSLLVAWGIWQFPDNTWAMVVGGGSFFSMFLRLRFLGQGGLLLGADPSGENFHINVIELYRYLHAAYSDAPDTSGAGTILLAADLKEPGPAAVPLAGKER